MSGELVVIVTTDYVLLKRDNGLAHVQGTIAVTGPDQEAQGYHVVVNGGQGSIDSVLTPGSLFAKTKAHFETKMHLVREDGTESDLGFAPSITRSRQAPPSTTLMPPKSSRTGLIRAAAATSTST